MKENITVIGIGRLGLCFSLILEKAGYNIIGVDINEQYVIKIEYIPYSSGDNTSLRRIFNMKKDTEAIPKTRIETCSVIRLLILNTTEI